MTLFKLGWTNKETRQFYESKVIFDSREEAESYAVKKVRLSHITRVEVYGGDIHETLTSTDGRLVLINEPGKVTRRIIAAGDHEYGVRADGNHLCLKCGVGAMYYRANEPCSGKKGAFAPDGGRR
jgi:hypothetical protein